jgi:hypothetical protein
MKSIRTFMLNTLVLALVNIADGKLIITEIMIEPKNALDTTTQWFEVYNTENTVVALKGRVFQYCSSLTSCQDATYPSVAFIGAYGYIVFGNNDNVATNGGVVTLKLALKTMTKSGSGYNSLSAATPASTAYDDFVLWSSDLSQYNKLPFSPGVSVSKIDELSGGLWEGNWRASSTLIDCVKGGDKGTPGKVNSYACPTKAPTKAPTKTPTKKPTNTPTKAPISIAPDTNPAQPTKPSNIVPSKAPILAVTAPMMIPTTQRPSKKCGLLGLGIVCQNGCGAIGRLLNLCPK